MTSRKPSRNSKPRANILGATVRKGGKVIFVGTKKQAQQCVKDTAKECGQFYVVERWLGGTMTNFNTIKTSIKRLKDIEKMDADGSLANYGKQEQAVIRREAARLQKYFDGIRAMDRLPAAMFVVDIKREHNAVAEARKLKIPIVALVDTNCDPDLADYPIAANDDAIRSVRMIMATVGQTITQAGGEFEARRSRVPGNGEKFNSVEEAEAAAGDDPTTPESSPTTTRLMRFVEITSNTITEPGHMEITAATVGKLREMTGAGMMDCKKALTESGGDLDKAVDYSA